MRALLLPPLGLLLALAGCATAPAPTRRPTGSSALEIRVLGTADDQSQGGAEVLVQSPRLSRPVWIVTNDEGRARLEHLPAGIYDLQIPSGDRVVAGVAQGQRARVVLRGSHGRAIACHGPPAYGIERSLLDDDAATDFRHEPRVVHRLP